MKKLILFMTFIFAFSTLFFACDANTQTEEQDKTFVTCTYDKSEDGILLKNKAGNYKLFIYVYGNTLKNGTYQVLGSDGEKELEGMLTKGSVEQDLKTSLFVEVSGDQIELSGTASLYKPKSVTKSGEVVKFSYSGKLTRK